MSAATWLAAHYPKEAAATTAAEALGHSVAKWEGLQKTALRRHKCALMDNNEVRCGDEFVLPVNAATCALCAHHYRPVGYETECESCPLARSRDGVRCDEEAATEAVSPWYAFHNRRPDVMLRALRKAARFVAKTTPPPTTARKGL